MSNGRVLVIGGINVDVIARTCDPPVQGTSNPGRTARAAGGVGRNVAECLARLGSPVRLVGAVGADDDGRRVVGDLERAGVEVDGVRTVDAPTGAYTAVLDDAGELVVGVADMAATEALTPDDVDAAWPDHLAWVVVDANLAAETLARALARAREAGVPTALDPVGAAKAARIGTLDGVHTFTPTVAELRAWSGSPDVEGGVRTALADGAEVVWVREGAAGSVLHTPGRPATRVALPPAHVVDVTGAGDAMLAAYVHLMAAGSDPVSAAWFGATAARLTVGVPGPVHPSLSGSLVHRTLEELTP